MVILCMFLHAWCCLHCAVQQLNKQGRAPVLCREEDPTDLQSRHKGKLHIDSTCVHLRAAELQPSGGVFLPPPQPWPPSVRAQLRHAGDAAGPREGLSGRLCQVPRKPEGLTANFQHLRCDSAWRSSSRKAMLRAGSESHMCHLCMLALAGGAAAVMRAAKISMFELSMMQGRVVYSTKSTMCRI